MAKAKLVQVRRPSADALELADELLAIARDDLRAARLLRKNSLPAQAMFSLQQSVEKTGKAHGLATGLAQPTDLQHEWSHNSLRLSELMADYRAQQAALKATGSALAGAPPAPVTAERPKAFIQSFDDPKALKEPFLGLMVEWCRASITEYQAFKANPAHQQRQEQQMVAWIIEGRKNPAESCKASAYGVFLARALAESAVLLPAHMVLGMATLPHAVRARYPNLSLAPEDLYTSANPVVARFDELCAICEPYIGAAAAFVALARTLGGILDMLSDAVVEQT